MQTARRGYDAARRANDLTRAGLLTMHHSLGLAWIGARHRVTGVLDEALGEITPDPSAADTGLTQAAGMLHLTAAMHHARQQRADEADDHLGHAEEPARSTGECNALLQHFGPTNVATWGLNVAVELGHGPAVAEAIDTDVPRLLDTFGSAVRGGALHLDLARAYAQAEDARDAEAIRHLDAADRLAPQYVRPDPMARDLVTGSVSARVHGGEPLDRAPAPGSTTVTNTASHSDTASTTPPHPTPADAGRATGSTVSVPHWPAGSS